MADDVAPRDTHTPVQIRVFNQTYRVVSADGAERAERAARLVDERMREAASQMVTHDAVKVAVMAALNIADDLLTLREAGEAAEQVSASPDAGGAAPATWGGEQAQAPSRISWYESVFDEGFGSAQGGRERMSSQVKERLRPAGRPEGGSVERKNFGNLPAAGEGVRHD